MDFWFLCPRFTLLRSDGQLCDGPPDGSAGCVACNHPELAAVAPMAGAPALTVDPPAQLRALAAADHVIAPSRFLGEMFARNGFPRDRIEVVPYGLEPGRIVRAPVARPRQPLRLGYCGVLSPWKAPHLAVEAVRGTMAPVELRVHGNTGETMFTDYIAKVRAAAGGDARITFPGAYGETEAAQVFADMDALVVPSTWYENTPFVVLEAFAAGVPVIASDLGGLREIVQDGGNGLLFRAGDAAALRAAIERLAADPQLFARLLPKPPHAVDRDYERFVDAYRG